MEVDATDTPAADTPEPAVNGKAHHEPTKAEKAAKSAKATKRHANTPRRSGKKKLSEDDWELDCEICGSKGINRVSKINPRMY